MIIGQYEISEVFLIGILISISSPFVGWYADKLYQKYKQQKEMSE